MSAKDLLEEYAKYKTGLDKTVKKLAGSTDKLDKYEAIKAKARERYALKKQDPEWAEQQRQKNRERYQAKKAQKATQQSDDDETHLSQAPSVYEPSNQTASDYSSSESSGSDTATESVASTYIPPKVKKTKKVAAPKTPAKRGRKPKAPVTPVSESASDDSTYSVDSITESEASLQSAWSAKKFLGKPPVGRRLKFI